MKVSSSNVAEQGRRHQSIGRIQAVTRWRGTTSPVTNADRLAAVQALIREADDCDADAIIELRFEVDRVQSADVDATPLQRIAAIGLAVRYADAA
jgi:uncharacterized protein YbjQ (UPF0145 family)